MTQDFRYGYACINMSLKKTYKTLRQKTLEEKGFDYLKSLVLHNLTLLYEQLKWNLENNVFFMRITSDLFPFASHMQFAYDISFAKNTLQAIGNYAKVHGMRLTFHSSPYVILNSKNPDVVEKSIKELQHYIEIIDFMGLDQDTVIIVHGGGIYGNKTLSLKRLQESILNLPSQIRERIVLENCEMAFNVTDLLPISKATMVPIVVDYHHHDINPSNFDINEVFAIWDLRNIKPKIHISNSRPGITSEDNKTKRRAHSEYIRYLPKELLDIHRPLDIMLEVKAKELALQDLLNNYHNIEWV